MDAHMKVITVDSLELPELAPYRTLRRPVEHYAQGIFVAEGEKVVRRLLASALDVLTMLLTPEWFEALGPAVAGRPHTVYLAPRQLCESIVGYNLHQGIMAIGRIPPQRSIEETVGEGRGPMLLVALDGLVHAENVGVVMRNCAAFGVDAVLVGETSSSPFLRRAVRNSMGAAFHLPVVHCEDLAGAIRGPLRARGVITAGAHPHAARSLYDWTPSGRTCLVLGNEGLGLSDEVLRACDERVAIPMHNNTDSLNVASASAVFLAEFARRRLQTS